MDCCIQVAGGFEQKNLAKELVVIKTGQICIREHFNNFLVSEGLLQSLGTVRFPGTCGDVVDVLKEIVYRVI